MAEDIYVFDKRPDIFEVQGKNEDYNYRWVNDSEGCAMNFETRKREYYEIAKDPGLKAQFSSDHCEGEATVIKANNERYVLMKRPKAASEAQFLAENAAKEHALKRTHQQEAPRGDGVRTEWQCISKQGRDGESPRPASRKGR